MAIRHGARPLIATYRGHVALTRGNLAGAFTAHVEALGQWRAIGDDERVADSLTQLGMVALLQGDLAAANEQLEEALTLCRSISTPFHVADALQALGFTRFLLGDAGGALPLLAEGLQLFHRLSAQAQIATGLDEYAFIAYKMGSPIKAAKFLGAATAIRERIGIPRPAAYDALYQQLLDGLQADPSADLLHEAMESGGALQTDEAVALATSFLSKEGS